MPCPPFPSSFGNIMVVSSTTRPIGLDLYAGRRIYETDTGRELLYDGTGWVIMSEPAQSWAPVWVTGITAVGNGAWSLTGYNRSDGYIDIYGVFTCGSTTTYGAAVLGLTLPIAAASMAPEDVRGELFDSSAVASFALVGNPGGTTTLNLNALGAAATYTSYNATVATTTPVALATGDTIKIGGRYRMTTRYS